MVVSRVGPVILLLLGVQSGLIFVADFRVGAAFSNAPVKQLATAPKREGWRVASSMSAGEVRQKVDSSPERCMHNATS